jgi:hypothetical protein
VKGEAVSQLMAAAIDREKLVSMYGIVRSTIKHLR